MQVQQHIPKYPLSNFIQHIVYVSGALPIPYIKELPQGGINLVIELNENTVNTVYPEINAGSKKIVKNAWITGMQKQAIVDNVKAIHLTDVGYPDGSEDWVSQSINSAIRTYAENARAAYMGGLQSSKRVEIPTGVSLFPKEAQFPNEWAQKKANVVSFNIMNKGSHFAAMEQPEVYAGELAGYFGKV
jgi:pimeloyl-ACP methyl ester carboxylesterase